LVSGNHLKKKKVYFHKTSYQVSANLAKQFRGKDFLEIDQSATRIAYGGHVCKWIGTK
jgi:hypothetical protein